MIWEQSVDLPKIPISQDLLLVYGTNDPDDLNLANSVLSQEEVDYANRLKSDSYKCLWISCHVKLKLMLGAFLNLHPKEVELKKNNFGKPYLADSNLCFNLSHTNDSFLLGFTIGGRIGVDLDKLTGREDIPALIDYAFSAEEANYCTEGEKALHFIEIWTLKEAYLKATGVGLLDNLKSVNVHGYSNNAIYNNQLSKNTIMCPNGETASLVFRNDKSISYVWLS